MCVGFVCLDLFFYLFFHWHFHNNITGYTIYKCMQYVIIHSNSKVEANPTIKYRVCVSFYVVLARVLSSLAMGSVSVPGFML